ncbi:MAG TPA: universal stress protein [Actinospica sp.]|nr:universal stress protein [Actinospica sp.]
MSTVTESRIVVGVDGSPASAAALEWAAAEARAHGAPLLVVHVLDARRYAAVYSPAHAAERAESDDVLAEIKGLIDRVGAERIEQVYEIGVPALALVQRSRGARLLVLGHALEHRRPDGDEYLPGPVLGPVARACLARAECPVVVVPEPVAGRTAAATERPRHHDPVAGARAIYPFQGRIPVAHH